MERHTYEMGLIGNCQYIGTVGKNADVQWLCWPQFDSSFVFGSLMDQKKGGEFCIQPEGFSSQDTVHQRYLPHTNILETIFQTKEGKFKILDFAPRFRENEDNIRPIMLVRRIIPLDGTPKVSVQCRPVYEYGQTVLESQFVEGRIEYYSQNAQLELNSSKAKEIYENKSFELKEEVSIVLEWTKDNPNRLNLSAIDAFEKTKEYWLDWIDRGNYPEFEKEAVKRSALVLKLHQFETTGAVIASCTTSLPEHPGSGRNWDYRYCWFRDAWFTLDALDKLGYRREWSHFANFIVRTVEKENKLVQPLYTINGVNEIPESEHQLKGYQDNQPVRIGNAAWYQIQNDVYGQLLLSLKSLYLEEDKRMPSFDILEKILDFMQDHLVEKDAGIWEYRNLSGTHTESLLFHYLGCEAVIEIAQKYEKSQLAERAQNLLVRVREEIEKTFNPDEGWYGVSQESTQISNASEYLLLTLGYLEKDHPVAKSHVEILDQKLLAEGKFTNNLVYRYRSIDDFGETKGTFLICAYWRLQALAMLGEIEKARKGFDDLKQTANHLGILSEDVDAKDNSQWGNFAQTYSHSALIQTAIILEQQGSIPVAR